MGALHCLGSGRTLFVDIAAARRVLLGPHRIHLKEFTRLRKKPEDRGWLYPVWGTPGYSREHHNSISGRRPVLEMGLLKEFHSSGVKSHLVFYVLDQHDLCIKFAHLIAKRQLHSVMEGLRQLSKSSADDERGYGSINSGTIYRNAAKKPRTT
ncbi:Hypothetical protein PHPALM_5025 [Phytophthora palmivora]|uniref:Uncharacterized protein n=1 Tax=Phytophthora palmivora TaxID=4796 RepID=A0A2P4YIH2_9STRA|nr:Hypothetical protein PHPALM_5025 [Phytophthora palmivora]